jgi:mannose-6-phosphate isomerase-like protein (cupin superfamily)
MGPEPFRMIQLDQRDRVPLEHGTWRPVRRALGITAFAVNAYTAESAGGSLIEPHDETSAGAGGHEELYFVARGAATFTIDGRRVEAPAGTMVLVQPGTRREATAGADETTVLVIGGRPGAAMPPSPFEYWYAAITDEEAGELERAYATVAEGLAHWPDHGTIHYVLGCYAARLGHRDEALEHLRTAFANDPRTREWAADDPDLEGLRGDPDYPEG